MKKTSLTIQFRQTFVLIVISSIVASIITIALSAFLLVVSMNKTIYPPNFYERQVPYVEAYIRSENTNILASKSGIKDVIQGDGLFYQVVDVISSIVASIITIALSAFLLVVSMNKTIYPPNFYERQVPYVEAYIRSENTNILASKSGIKDVIQGDGLFYQVVDNNGDILYGTFPIKLFTTKDELFDELLNSIVLRHKYYVKTIPIEENGEFMGAVLLAYKIKMTFVNTAGKFVAAFFFIIPNITVYLFIWVYTYFL